MIFRFFIVAVLLFLGFRMLNFVAIQFKLSQKLKSNVFNLLPVIELFVWITYIIWIVKVIYDSKNYFALISIAIVFTLIAFPLIVIVRDFISGILLKLQNKMTTGSLIEVDGYKGTIKNAGHLRMDIEDKLGNITSMSYYKIRSKKISRPGMNQNLEKVHFEFEFPETVKINQKIELLKKELLKTPWVAITQPVIVEKINTVNGKYIVSADAYVLDDKYAENIKTLVESGLQNA